MPLLSAISNKRRSHPPGSSSLSSSSSPSSSSLLSRLPLNQSSPAVYSSSNAGNAVPVTVHPRAHRSTDYHGNTGSGTHHHHHHHHHHQTPQSPPYDILLSASPAPTPSTSWTTEVSMLVDKIRGDTSSVYPEHLDRRSISQGIKLVAIAADEYDDGNDTVALDIYLSGIDKIIMALPNKTDERTKAALREKLTSVEERVGILNLAIQHSQNHPTQVQEDDDIQSKSFLETFSLRRVASTLSSVAATARARNQSDQSNNGTAVVPLTQSSITQPSPVSKDSVDRFKRFGQLVIHIAITLAVLIKQSPLPDIVYFLFGYVVQLLLWVDRQYHIVEKAQDFGVECIKLLLWADQEYHIHEFASEAMYILIAAGLKAAVAYKEAPAYRQHRPSFQTTASIHLLDEQQSHHSPSPLPPQPPLSRSPRTAWVWTPWR